MVKFVNKDEALPTIDELFENNDTYIYIYDLKHRGIEIFKEALKREATQKDIVVYKGSTKNKTKSKRWIQQRTIGEETPEVIGIESSNGCHLIDYSRFDKRVDVKTEDALELINGPLAEYGFKRTVASIIAEYVPIHKIDFNKYFAQINAFRGGATHIRHHWMNKVIDKEIHIDYHQMYASIIKENFFPHDWVFSDQFVLGDYNIYAFKSGSIKLKPDGYNLLFKGVREDKWTQLHNFQFTNADFMLLLANYEVKDFEFNFTLIGNVIYQEKKVMGLIDDIYEKRKKATNPAIKKFYKLLNENIPGKFEQSSFDNKWWADLEGPTEGKTEYYNNLVGIWITAFGRQKLNTILHLLDRDKVIGWDTDAVFYNDSVENLPDMVACLMGDNMGQLHIDGDYHKVYHIATKQYIGYDENNQPFGKIVGVPDGSKVAEELFNHTLSLVEIQGWDAESQSYEYVLSNPKLPQQFISKFLNGGIK